MRKPLKSFTVGKLSVSLWDNGQYKNVSVRKTFFNTKEKKPDHQAVSVDPSDVPCLIRLLRKMENEVITEGGTNANHPEKVRTGEEGSRGGEGSSQDD